MLFTTRERTLLGGAAAALAAVAILLLASLGLPPGLWPSASRPSPQAQFNAHVDHVVVLMEENHAFDNYFGTYCAAVGPNCPYAVNGEPPGLCVPNDPAQPSGACTRPHAFGPSLLALGGDMPHAYDASVTAWNGGAMDGFYQAEGAGTLPFGYYNGSTAPLYWDLAQEYALSDRFFSSTLSYSLPNHWHLLAGQSPQEAVVHIPVTVDPAVLLNRTLYLEQANATRTIEDLLLGTSISWKYYDRPNAASYDAALGNLANGGAPTGRAFDLWAPLQARPVSYAPNATTHFVNNTQFFSDARTGQLPNISWVIPYLSESDHPPQSVAGAEQFVASVVDAVESSPEWNRTVLFVTWDDYGGFYDHLAPPTVDGLPLGFRVPTITVGPFVRPGYVSHALGFFETFLRLMELRWHLPCLTALDCGATPALDMFDFASPARSPMLFGTNASLDVYPLPASGRSPATAGPVPPFFAPAELYAPALSAAPDSD